METLISINSAINNFVWGIPAMVCILGLGVIWEVAETFNGLMAIPNLIGVFLLSGTVVKLVRNYFSDEEYIPYHEQAKMLKGD